MLISALSSARRASFLASKAAKAVSFRWMQFPASRSTPVSDVLSRYPTFNLSNDGRGTLGPQPDDEAVLTLSGGVDSSIAAYLALQQGKLQPVKTIFMRNWNSLEEQDDFRPGAGGASGCTWLQDWDKVQQTARKLDLSPELLDLSNEYWNDVFAPSLEEWRQGLTPNPDISCNREIKFGELFKRTKLLQPRIGNGEPVPFGRKQVRRWLVTGHYAHLTYYRSQLQPDNLHGKLHRAADSSKDQSYFLSAVGSDKLGRTHLPLANINKSEVRHLAQHLGLPTAKSEESMGLCFVGERRGRTAKTEKDNSPRGMPASRARFSGFLADYIEPYPGKIVTNEGLIVGSHQGLHTFTIGQGARIGGSPHRWFVASKRKESNEIVVVAGGHHPLLQCTSLTMKVFETVSKEDSEPSLIQARLFAQIRHRHKAVPCTVSRTSLGHIQVSFDEPVSSVAEGQTCALYRVDECLGSGNISFVSTLADTV